MFQRPFQKAVMTGLGALLAGACGGRDPAPPVNPSPLPQPGTWTIAGTVWVHQGASATKAQGGQVFGWVERQGGGATTGPVAVGQDGRYQFTVPVSTTRIFLERGSQAGHQPCGVTLPPGDNLAADLHVVADDSRLGANLPAELAAKTPTLSGVVYENTPEGRRPVPGAWVWLDGLNGLGVLVADTLTDADGRYLLCGVPAAPRLALSVSATGFEPVDLSSDQIGTANIDIEMKRK